MRGADVQFATAVARCAAAVARAQTEDEVVSTIADQAMVFGASAAAVFLTRLRDPLTLRLVAHRCLSAALADDVAHVTFHTPHLTGRAATSHMLQIVEDLDRLDPDLTGAANLLAATGSRSMMSVPLIAFDQLYGVLTWTHAEPFFPTAAERTAICALAEVFAIGIAKTEASDAKADTPYTHLVRAVAQRHHLEAALRDQETRIRAIFDHATQFVGLLSSDGTLLEANRTALEFAGVPRDAVIGRPFWEGPWWQGSVELQGQLQQAIARAARGEFVRYEVAHVNSAGKTILVDFSLSPVKDETGAVVLIVPEGHDITARKDWERLREEWLSIVAHDLRQPVNAIHLRARLLARSRLATDPELKRGLDHITSSVAILGHMISDLLDASQIEAGRVTLNRRPVEVEGLIRDIVARNVGASGEVRFDVHGTIPTLDVDRDRIEQVLANLLSNGVKYGRDGAPLEVAIGLKTDGVTLSVTNWGDGIDATEMPQLFRRFHRTGRARASKVAGIGLGLYVARGLVEAHGGRLWAESEPGAKTTFHVLLPVA